MLLHCMIGAREPSQLHHPDLFIRCLSNTDFIWFPRSTNRSHAPTLSSTQGHQRHLHLYLRISLSILHKHQKVWLEGNPTFQNDMLWVASMTTFFSFCRSREITVQYQSKFYLQTHLCLLDIFVDNTRTNDNLCPVTALFCYHTYSTAAMLLIFSFNGTTIHLYQNQNLLIMSIMHC